MRLGRYGGISSAELVKCFNSVMFFWLMQKVW